MTPRQLRTLILLFSANTISGFAQGVTILSIPWYIIHQPGGKFLNPLMVALVTMASMFWGLYAGTLVDRYNRKNIFLTINAADGVVMVSLASIGFYLGYMPIILVALAYTTTIFTYNVHFPNLYAFVQELFEPKYYARVNSAIEIQGQTTNFIGMMIGGLLIDGSPQLSWWPEWLEFSPWSMAEIFLLDGGTYVIGVMLIWLIPYVPSASKLIDTGSIVKRLRQGFKYLNANRYLFIFGVASHVLFFSLLVVVHVVAPVYVNDYLEEPASILAFFKGLYAVGAVIAGLIGLSALVRRSNLIRQIIFLLAMAGGLYLVLAFTHSIALTLSLAVLLGIGNAGTRILRITYLVRLVPNRVIGRVNSIFAVINVLMRVAFYPHFIAAIFLSRREWTQYHLCYDVVGDCHVPGHGYTADKLSAF